MVNVIEMTVGETRKLNMGNYESKELFLSLKANVSNEDVGRVHEDLQRLISKRLDAQEAKVRDSLKG